MAIKFDKAIYLFISRLFELTFVDNDNGNNSLFVVGKKMNQISTIKE